MFSNIPDRAQIAQGTTAAPVETAAERVVRLRDEGMAQQAAEREEYRNDHPLAAFTPRVYSDATINFVNPYFTNSGPRYHRFDYTQTGSGVTGTQNPALWFDQLFGSPFASLADTPPASADIPGSDTHKIMAGPTLGGRSGGRHYVELMWGEQAAANTEYNLDVLGARGSLNSSLADSMFTDALAAAGISPSDYASMDAINALDPRKKLQFLDIYTRMQEEKNQRPNFGFSDALGIGLSVAAAFAPGPWSAAALGASGAAASGGDLGDIALAGGIAGLGNWAGGKLGDYWDNWRAGQASTNAAALGGTAADLYPMAALGETAGNVATTGTGLGINAANVFGTGAVTTGTGLGINAANVFGALPATGSSVLAALSPVVSTSITPGGRIASFYNPSASAIRGTTAGAALRSSGRGGLSALSSQGLGRNIVHAGLSSIADSIRAPSEGGGSMLGKVADQLPRVPTITYPDYAPVRSGVPGQAGFERTSNIGVPSEYGYVPTGLTPETALPYGSGLDPYALTEGPNFDVSPYFQGPKLFHRGGGVVNVDSGARPTDQESFYKTYESGSQQYSDNLGEGMGITYDRVEGTDIPPQSRLQVFETPPMGVGSLNGTARDMTRYAYGGGVGSLNDTARAMTYAGGGMVGQPFKVKIKNQSIFGEFMGYTKTGKVRVLDEDGVERLYPKSQVKREYSDEPLPVEGDFRANLEGIPETVDRYSRPDAREERQFDDWQDNRGNDRVGGSGLYPTANLTDLRINDGWGASGRVGVGFGRRGANTIDVGANIDRTGVTFSDLKARLGLGDVSSDLSLLGPLLDPYRFEGALNVPVGQGRAALTGGLPLKDFGEPNVGLTYGQKFAVGGPIIKAAATVGQPFKVKIKNQSIFGDFMGYTKNGKVRVLEKEGTYQKIRIYPKSRVRRAYSDEPLPDEPVKKAVGGPIIKTAAELLKRDPAGFFNKSQRVIQEAKLPQATGQRWQQLFQDKGINKAELGGLGLLAFLGLSRDEPITKEAVAEFIDENRLEVGEDYRSTKGSETGEVVLFEPPLPNSLTSHIVSYREISSGRSIPLPVPGPDGGPFSGFHVKIGAPDLEESTRRPTNFSVVDIGEYGDNRHSEWRIIENRTPGGPKEVTDVSGSLDEVKVKLTELLRERGDLADTGEAPRWGDQILDPMGQGPINLNYREIALTDQQTGGLHKNTRELVNKLAEQPMPMAGFKPFSEAQTQLPQHNFPENTLVHTRVTDRPVEINGVDHENVLYVEEFQSDWAQGAIGRGILRPEDISRKAELLDKLKEIKIESVRDMRLYQTAMVNMKRKLAIEERTLQLWNELEELDRKQAYTPFLESGDKKGSVNQSPVISLAIRRILKEAVDNGQDYVVFANYNDQVTRWGPDEERRGKLRPIYQETTPNLIKKIVKNLGGYVKPTYKTKVDALIIEKTRELNAARAEEASAKTHRFNVPRERYIEVYKRGEKDEGYWGEKDIATLERELSSLKAEQTRLRVPLKEKESRYYKQHPDEVGKEEDAFFADTYLHPEAKRGRAVADFVMDMQRWENFKNNMGGDLSDADIAREIKSWYSGAGNTVNALLSDTPILEPSSDNVWATIKDRDSPKRFVVHITDAMAKKIREEGQPVLSRAAGGPIIKRAVKTLTKPKKAPSLPSETLLATRPVEPLVPRAEASPTAAVDVQPVHGLDDRDEFNWNLYHGTRDDIREFNLDHPNRKDTGWLGTGVYGDTDPRLASEYSHLKSGYGDPNVMPLKARLTNPYHATMADKERLMLISIIEGAEAGREAADAWTAELKQKGHDGVILSSGNEGHSEVVVFDPANIRSKFAKFDPAKKGSADILAAAGGPIIKGAAKVLTKPKKAPSLPAETLMATSPVEPLASTPVKAPAITGATDLTKGTRIRFTEPVFEGSYKKPRFVGNRTIEGTILKDSYGAKRGQHTFTIEVHSAEGYDADNVKSKIRRKGRTVYKDAVVLEQPSNQAELAAEKHARAAVAKDAKYKTWIEEAEDDPYQQVSTLLKLDKIPSDWLADNVEWRARVERLSHSKAAGGGGVSSLNGIARNMTRYAYGGGVGSMNETARSM